MSTREVSVVVGPRQVRVVGTASLGPPGTPGADLTVQLAQEVSDRSAADTAEETARDAAIETHRADTTNVHGIADTSLLATQAYVLARVAELVNTSPAELDTFLEVYNRFLTDESAATALATTVAGKQAGHADLTALSGVGVQAYGKALLALTSGASFTTLLRGLLDGTYLPQTPTAVTVAGLTLPVIAAHRGGANRFPENTLEAFGGSVGDGLLVQEMDLQTLADGEVVIMHDSTVDRTLSGTGNVVSFTRATWDAMYVDADSWFLGGFGKLSPPYFSDVLDQIGGRAVLLIDLSKDDTATVQALQMCEAHPELRDTILPYSTGTGDLDAWVAAGYTCMWQTSSASVATIQAAGIEWALVDGTDDTNLAYVQTLLAGGIKVAMYTLDRRWQTDLWIGRGVHMIVSNSARYVYGTVHRLTTGAFDGVDWKPGMMFADAGNGRGTRPPGGWKLAGTAGMMCVVGTMCPVATPTSWTLDIDVYHVTVPASSTLWFGLYICCPTDKAAATTSGGAGFPDGYLVMVRYNGDLELWKCNDTANTSTQVSGETNTGAITAGTTVHLTIEVTATTITVTRTDTGNPAHTHTWTDSTWRGEFFHIGRVGDGTGLTVPEFRNPVLT